MLVLKEECDGGILVVGGAINLLLLISPPVTAAAAVSMVANIAVVCTSATIGSSCVDIWQLGYCVEKGSF